MKDWKGNKTSVLTIGIGKDHSTRNREENDFYATSPEAVELLLEAEQFAPSVWECACGAGHISETLIKNHYKVYSTDLCNRGYGFSDIDFLKTKQLPYRKCDIITNPPYRYAKEFVEHSLDLLKEGSKCAMLLRIQFLEGVSRRDLFKKYPPKVVYCPSRRIECAKNGNFDQYNGKLMMFVWFVWQKGYKGNTIIKWI